MYLQLYLETLDFAAKLKIPDPLEAQVRVEKLLSEF